MYMISWIVVFYQYHRVFRQHLCGVVGCYCIYYLYRSVQHYWYIGYNNQYRKRDQFSVMEEGGLWFFFVPTLSIAQIKGHTIYTKAPYTLCT